MNQSSPKSGVLIATSPFGATHARRGLAVGKALESLRPDLPIHYATGGADAEIYRRAGVDVDDVLLFERYPVSDGRLNTQRLRSLFVRSEVQHAIKMASLIARYRPELVWLDEMLLSVFVAKSLGCRVAFVTNQPTFPRPPLAGGLDPAISTWATNGLRRRAIRTADVAFYVGSREHLPESRLWPWVEQHMQVVDRISSSSSASLLPRAEALQRLHLAPEKPLVVVTVGGLDMGRYLLEAAIKAWPLASAPDAQLLAVCGPLIDPKDLPEPASDAVRVLGFVEDLPAYLAAADLAIMLAGITTMGECLAAGTPLLCVPIKGHREQENNARWAQSMGLARVLQRDQVSPLRLAQEVTAMLRQSGHNRQLKTNARPLPIVADGATRAALHINRLLPLRPMPVTSPKPELAGVA